MRRIQTMEGSWSGSLKLGAQTLRIVFHFKRTSEGEWAGTLDSPDQGAFGIAISRITLEGRKLTVRVDSISGVFEGTLSEDGKQIVGEWSQLGNKFPLTLTFGEPPKPRRPQEPQPPFPYRMEEVRVMNRTARIELAGTLTLPEGKPPFPGVVFFTGSGAQNRDQEVFGHKPFLVLADHLTRSGFATLRMDDRGVGDSQGDMRTATTLDFVTDLLAGVSYLRSRREIDRRRVGVLGHSEGALVATIASARAPRDIAFAILMAPTGVPGEQILYRQAELIARKSGVSEALIESNRKLQERVFEILKRERDNTKAKQAIVDELLKMLGNTAPSENQRANLEAQAESYTLPWFRTFVQLDPAPHFRRVRCPVLILNGTLDLQVDPDQNLPVIEQALRTGRNRRYTIRRLEGLNHLFQRARTGLITEYAQIEETINPTVLEIITDWLKQVAK